ncbi:barstar family protein [Cumulibacter manganitolerans]|uniref:barstar family protein n=1 Tax=Cumulibacter manganitolerans TaxID=1884992 RepID=UPI0018861C75|nr:barstar family protein [Cumulibacter manganitolerans]
MIATVGPDEPVDVTLARLRRAGRTPYVVSGATKAELLDSFARALSFPAYFGHNLDALADSLRDARLRTPATIVWDGAASLARADRATYRAVATILATRLPRDVEALECLR